MEVKLPEEYGFCFGVQRAIDLVEENIEQGNEAHTLGPIVHNDQVVENFAEKGIVPIDDLSEAKKDNIILRAHGISPQKRKEIENHERLNLIDGTCPLVGNVQDRAKELDGEGYDVVIIGEKGHPEVEGLKSHGNAVAVLENKDDVKQLYESSRNQRELKYVGAVLQTTQSEDRVNNVLSELAHRPEELRIYNTRCLATQRRQEAAIDLAEEVDGMVVAGGYHSSNTTRLAEVSSEYAPTIHIETVEDLNEEKNWFKENEIESVGLTAGASTPDEIIKDIRKELENYKSSN